LRREERANYAVRRVFFSLQKETEMITNFLKDETGLELSEYAVAAALIALAVVGIFTTLGNNINGVISNLANKIK
jgi:pilus assembly protein Flp/PilA